MSDKSIEPVKVSGPVIKKDEDISLKVSKCNKIDEILKRKRAEASKSIPKFTNEKALLRELKKVGIYDKDTGDIGIPSKLQTWGKTLPTNIISTISTRKLNMFQKIPKLDGTCSLKGMGKEQLETADLSGIFDAYPYMDALEKKVQPQANSRMYIINGKVVSGWALYYGPNSIRSPEDYTKNVDMVYNVPYVFSAFEIKAQLGLGAEMRVTAGDEVEEDNPTKDSITTREETDTTLETQEAAPPGQEATASTNPTNTPTDEQGNINPLLQPVAPPSEEEIVMSKKVKWTDWFLKKKLRVDVNFRKKISFHKSLYGNAYIHIHRDENELADKLTILQPERMKLYLDPLTTKILFFVYLPPIIGGTMLAAYPSVASSPSSQLLNAPVLRFPSPVVIPVSDMIHFKTHDYTEYPFGFSELKSATDICQARFDINLLAPYYFKRYCKTMLHIKYNNENVIGGKLDKKIDDMTDEMEGLEPGSDLVTGPFWEVNEIGPSSGQSEIFALTNDLDEQLFAVTGVPITYFKPKGSTDRLVTNEDKVFLGKLRQEQEVFIDQLMRKVIIPAIDYNYPNKDEEEENSQLETAELILTEDVDNDPKFSTTLEYGGDSDYTYEGNYPKIEFGDITKTDLTQEIGNTMVLLDKGIIDRKRAAERVGERPPSFDFSLNPMSQEETESDMVRLRGGGDMNKRKNKLEVQNPAGKQKHTGLNDNSAKNSNGENKKLETQDNFMFYGGKKYKVIKKV